MKEVKLSYYNHVKETKCAKVMGLNSFLEGIKNGEWQDVVLDVRTGKIDKKTAKIPAVTLSALFAEKRGNKNAIQKNGLMQIDIDAKDQNMEEVSRKDVENDQYSYTVFDSISGNGGFKVIVKIDVKNDHKEVFESLRDYYLNKFNIFIDIACKDLARLCYVSYDPDLYVNEDAKVFKDAKTREQKTEAKKFKEFKMPVFVKSDFNNAVQEASKLNLFEDYVDYINLAFALCDEFGASGEDYFHALCQSSSKYDYQTARDHYKICLQRENQGITIKTLYWIFKKYNIEVVSTDTTRIENLIKNSINPKEDALKLGIENAEEIINQLDGKVKKEDKTELQLISDLIKIENIKFNEVERNYEFNGELMNDRILANFYTKVWECIDENISKDKIFTLIQNPNNHVSYHPIRDWFQEHKNIEYSNEFEKLKKCFTLNANFLFQGAEYTLEDDFLDVYLKKWLISIVASSHGIYSLLILVLIGKQGINKTEFFRNLFPKKLQNYYADSTLDEGKDSEILMCKKLLITDDEFGGKSKKDANKLKRLSSQQTFSIRMPYGRVSEDLTRLAVLAGTSNELEVINDPTGNRRIIPIMIEDFDIQAYKAIDKDKLFVELYHEWVKDNYCFVLTKREIEVLHFSTLRNQEVMAEEEIINKLFSPCNVSKMTTTDITIALQMEYPQLKTSTKKVGMTLKKLGYEQTVMKQNGKVYRFYGIKVNR